MLSKKSSFNGEVLLKFEKTALTVYPAKNSNGFSLYISMDNFNGETLSMNIESDRKKSSLNTISVEKMNQPLLELSVESINLTMDSLQGCIQSYEKEIKIIGQYNLRTCGGFVEAIFKYRNDWRHTVFTMAHTNVYAVHNWLTNIWPLKGRCKEYYVEINNSQVKESFTFANFCEGGRVSIDVSEKCYVAPLTEDNFPTIVPWSKTVSAMIARLSKSLGVDSGIIRLFDGERRILEKDSEVNIEDLRSDEEEVPRLFYEVMGTAVRCSSIKDTQCVTDVSIYEERTVSEVKRRLGHKLHTECDRFIVCRSNCVLPNNETVSTDDRLKYWIGRLPMNITAKNLIGRGSYGQVFKCTDRTSREIFALKSFLSTDTTATNMMEMSILITLQWHNNIIRYLDLYVDNDIVSIALEYVPQGTLLDYIGKQLNGYLDECTIRTLSHGMLLGLQHLHGNKIMHRDIKSTNVLIGEHLVAKLCDFGLSKVLTNYKTTELSEGLNQTMMTTSFRWMAPEIICNEKYGLKIDIWSMGATVVEMITGRIPNYKLEDNMAALYRVGEQKLIEYESPYALSEPLQQFVDSCLTAEVKNRPNVRRLLLLPFFQIAEFSSNNMDI